MLDCRWKVSSWIECVGIRKHWQTEGSEWLWEGLKWDIWMTGSEPGLVMCSQYVAVSTYQKWSKERRTMSHGHSRLTYVRRKWRLVHLLKSYCSTVCWKSFFKNKLLAVVERCENTQCITACCIWVWVATHWSECSCWGMFSAESLWAI